MHWHCIAPDAWVVVVAGREGVSCLNELHQLVHVEVLRIPDRVEPSCGRKILRR